MAKRVFLHVGTPKTGTTYLQSVLWTNKARLMEQGVLLPLDRVRDHFFLSNLGREAKTEIDNMPPRGRTAWDRMMNQVGAWDGDALISHELFAMTWPDRAEWIIDQLRSVADEVHPIITARDLARQVPAEWQQSIKHGRTHRLREFYDLLRAEDPQVLFWRAQELPTQVRMWSQGLPPEHVHLITVPPIGGPPNALWERFAGVVGIDPGSVDLTDNRPNESLGRVEIETLRRVNQFAPMGADKPLQQMMVRVVLAEGILAQRPDAEKFAPPADEHPWVVEAAEAMVAELRRLPCDVVGDLDELLPLPEPVTGLVPDDADDTEVAAVAVETISAVLYRSHERETVDLRNEINRLKGLAEKRDRRIANLEDRAANFEKRAKDGWAAYEAERARPLWRNAARRVRETGGKVVRRTPSGGRSDGH